MKNIIYILAIMSLCLSCSEKKHVEKHDLNSALKNRIKILSKDTSVALNFCELIPFDWDNIYIVPPYAEIKRFKKRNVKYSNNLASELSNSSLNEQNCILVFVKNRSILRYSTVSRQILDFAHLERNGLWTDSISKVEVCKNLQTKKEGSSLKAILD